MPVDAKYPYELAQIDAFSEKEGPYQRILSVEEVLTWMALDMAPSEISQQLNVPLEAVEHTIMLIPEMMSWREQQVLQTRSTVTPGARVLPPPK